MARLHRRARALLPLLVAIGWMGCVRPAGNDDGGTQLGQQVPFRERSAEAATGTGATNGLSAVDESPKSTNGVPFRDPQSLQAGTLLTVRLKTSISSSETSSRQSFAAVVDQAVIIDGRTIVPRGAKVSGTVESARLSMDKQGQGYIQLALNSIDLSGRELPVNTLDLFARGRSERSHSPGGYTAVRLEQGRRLTFRLAGSAPLSYSSQVMTPNP